MSTRFYCAVFFSLLTSAVLAQQPAVREREFPSMKLSFERGLEYAQADGRCLLLDLYTPAKATNPLPVLLWVHGESGRFAGRYPCPIASMVGNGYAVASIDYRSDADAKFPARLEDCKAAIRWLRANADRYKLDANHIGAWGFSDGGRLAVLLGVSGGAKEFEGAGADVKQSSAVQAVVDFAGPSNGGQDSNVLRYASGSAAPMIIVHGDKDKVAPASQSQALDTALHKASVRSTVSLIKGAGHDFKGLRGQGERAEAVNQFLDQQLRGGARTRYQLCRIDTPEDAWVDPIIDEPVGTQYKTFPAASLGPNGIASYLIYLPPGYETSSKHYPVLYYLHGGGGSQRVGDIWVQKLDAAIRAGQIPPMISVMVQGLPGGRFLDSPDGKTPIESVIIKDLIPHIDATYRTIPKRESRALEGLSMGGYGVFHLGFKYPEMFGMISGLCNGIPAPGKNYNGTDARPASVSDHAADPYTLAEKNAQLIRGRMPIRIIVGTEDFTLAANEAFHAYLIKLSIAHEYQVIPDVSHGYKEYYERHDFGFFKTIATK